MNVCSKVWAQKGIYSMTSSVRVSNEGATARHTVSLTDNESREALSVPTSALAFRSFEKLVTISTNSTEPLSEWAETMAWRPT